MKFAKRADLEHTYCKIKKEERKNWLCRIVDVLIVVIITQHISILNPPTVTFKKNHVVQPKHISFYLSIIPQVKLRGSHFKNLIITSSACFVSKKRLEFNI